MLLTLKIKRLFSIVILLVTLTAIIAVQAPLVSARDHEFNSQENSKNMGDRSWNNITDFNETADNQKLLPIADGRISTFAIGIPQLNRESREIIVYLPSDYAESNEAYPVLYLQDAQHVFTQCRNSGDEWLLNESIFDFYTNSMEEDFITVGITSDWAHFWDEYSPWVNDNMYLWMDPHDANRVQGGEGDAYLDFLINTLKPEVDRRFRTQPDQSHTAIGGYDMGALISLYAGLTHSNTFSKAIAISPAVWFAEAGGTWLSRNHLIELIETKEPPKDVSFYIDVGAYERNNAVDVRPAVNNAQGQKITFPQAYLEGAGTIIETLLISGVPNKNINQGDTSLQSWAVATTEEDTRDTLLISNYLPLFVHKGLDHFDIYIPFENRTRRIWVYLPPDYDFVKSYPVIYLPDAQHFFGAQTGAHIADRDDWLMDEKFDQIYEETGKGIIAVGIEFDYTHAWDEYMPWDNNNMDNWLNNVSPIISGKGKQFLDFIINNLKPVIDTRYQTLPNRLNTYIGGGSRVALFSIYAGLSRPDIFSKVMAMSPAVWLAEGGPVYPLGLPYWLTQNQMLGWISSHTVPTNVKFYLYIGGKEMSGPPDPFPWAFMTDGTHLTMPEVYQTGAYRVRTAMLTRGAKLIYVPNPDGLHYPSTWRKYVENALDWLGLY